jgi:hypothetical protein
LRIVQIVQLLLQSRARGGLNRGVIRTDGNETRTKGDAKTNKGCGFHETTVPGEA